MDEATFQTMAGMRVVYSLPEMEKVPVRRDILFKTVGDLRLKMDLYAPSDLISDTTRPAVIFVSGGDASADTLRTRQIGLYISYGQLLAASGFVGIVFDHRGLEGYTQLREVGEDTDDLVTYVRTHAASLGINPQRLCIWAFSAGPIYGLPAAFRTASPSIRCAIAYYGGMSLLNKRYFHYTEEEEPLFREFSPVCYLHDPPLVSRRCLSLVQHWTGPF